MNTSLNACWKSAELVIRPPLIFAEAQHSLNLFQAAMLQEADASPASDTNWLPVYAHAINPVSSASYAIKLGRGLLELCSVKLSKWRSALQCPCAEA